MESQISQHSEPNSEYISSLVRENEQLKLLNEKLYTRSLNQKRKILRLKKMIEHQPSALPSLDWEDVTNVLESINEERFNDK